MAKVKLILPSAVNVLLMLNDKIVTARRKGLSAEVALPSLRRRAKMVVHEEGVLPVYTEDE